jgi:hypothetical protein
MYKWWICTCDLDFGDSFGPIEEKVAKANILKGSSFSQVGIEDVHL